MMRGFRQARWSYKGGVLEPTVFELANGRPGYYKIHTEEEIRSKAKSALSRIDTRKELNLPGLTESEVSRHFSRLAEMNYGVDSGPYWLGSCTMKYNPKINERLSKDPHVLWIHPYQPEDTVQGALKIIYEIGEMLSKITGLPHFSLQPAAGAHGELTGVLMIKAKIRDLGERRDEVLIPESAHGSNFASAAMAGFKVVRIPPNEEGLVDLDALRAAAGEKTAGMMITNPNTLGLFETDILEITDIVHGAGGYVYYDGANLNAILGRVLLSDMRIDVAHLNLHKTFSAPHGSGGPGAGAVGVVDEFRDYLPVPVVRKRPEGGYYLDYSVKRTIGRVRMFYGNFGVIVKAWAYLKILGGEGLREVSEVAVLNANYVMKRLLEIEGIKLKFGKERPCKHEFVVSLEELKNKYGVSALHVAKRLLDYGVHAPTVYFPPIVKEALMIEPTECESPYDLDNFVEAMRCIVEEARTDKTLVLSAPHETSVDRLNEVSASRRPILSWRMYKEKSDR